MKTRSFIITLLLLLAVLPSKAVLKERNLAGTLAMLRIELTEYRQKLESETGARKEQSQQVMNQLLATMNKSQQNAIMLYSQKNGYVFDLSYACHEATEQYKTFKNTVGPFRSYVENANVEIARFDSLISDLSNMYVASLSERAKIDRNVCLTLAVYIRRTLNENRSQNQMYINIYNLTEQRLKNLNDYANKRYQEIQSSIFTNSGEKRPYGHREPKRCSEGNHRNGHREIQTHQEIQVGLGQSHHTHATGHHRLLRHPCRVNRLLGHWLCGDPPC